MPSKPSRILLAALLAVLSLNAREANAAEVCIAPQVSEALASCEGLGAAQVRTAAEILAAAHGNRSHTLGLLPTAQKKGRALRRDQFAPQPFDDAESALDASIRRFLCGSKPAPGDAAADEQRGEVELSRALLYFAKNRFEEAAVLFRAIAMGRAAQPAGAVAQRSYLEALNVLGSRIEPPRPSCYDDMARDVPVFITLYCKDGKDKAHEEECELLGLIERDILRLRAEDQVKKADKEGSSEAYQAGAEIYLRIWQDHHRAACEGKQHACARAEEILYNAARAYQAARLLPQAIATRKILIDPRYNLHNTWLAKKAVYEIGVNYQSIGEYAEAASWYERYAELNVHGDNAPEALADAFVLRLAFDQRDRAEKDADLFNKNHGTRYPARTAQIAFALAAHVLDHGDPEGGRRRLASAMSMIDKNATIDVKARAHALLGKVLVELGKRPEAAVEYEKVRALVRGGGKELRALGDGDESMQQRQLAATLTALGEAIFFAAEEKRLAAEAIPRPAFTGAGKVEEMYIYVGTTLRAWILARRKAINEAESAYAEVMAIEPAPPPRWVVASAARVASMVGGLAAQIRSVPPPKSWKRSGPGPGGRSFEALRASWIDALDQAGAPEQSLAKGAYRRCVDLSVKLQTGDDSSRACATWLSAHYPAEVPRLDEISPRRPGPAFGLLTAPLDAR